jgi:hypothetical protein
MFEIPCEGLVSTSEFQHVTGNEKSGQGETGEETSPNPRERECSIYCMPNPQIPDFPARDAVSEGRLTRREQPQSTNDMISVVHTR